jgi:HK97 family phage major capsid protein
MKGYGEGGYTAEGADAVQSEPTWGYAQINKTKITAYTEVSEEFEKLKPSFYLKEIQRNLTISLRKRLAREIVKGDGETGHITGILAPAAKVVALETSKDIEIGTIDEHTLSNIVLGFGGDEEVYRGVLILNKLDLKEFLKVRGTDKKPVYKVDFVNQTIDGVPYVISSHIAPHAAATAGAYTMVYGTLGHYDLVAFSPIEISKSTDYKFRQGQIAYRAVGMFGGNTTSFNAFVRIKKPTE